MTDKIYIVEYVEIYLSSNYGEQFYDEDRGALKSFSNKRDAERFIESLKKSKKDVYGETTTYSISEMKLN